MIIIYFSYKSDINSLILASDRVPPGNEVWLKRVLNLNNGNSSSEDDLWPSVFGDRFYIKNVSLCKHDLYVWCHKQWRICTLYGNKSCEWFSSRNTVYLMHLQITDLPSIFFTMIYEGLPRQTSISVYFNILIIKKDLKEIYSSFQY